MNYFLIIRGGLVCDSRGKKRIFLKRKKASNFAEGRGFDEEEYQIISEEELKELGVLEKRRFDF